MSRHRRRPRSRAGLPPALLLSALCTGAFGAFAGIASVPPEMGPLPQPRENVVLSAATPHRLDARTPARIDIGRIGVSSDVDGLARRPDGSMETPSQWGRAGWYAEGVLPGDPGPAVIAGHRDSAADGPAVFFRLGDLVPGDEITVTAHGGDVHRFVVVGSQRVSKVNFPSQQVYAPSSVPLLKVITCTGDFDSAAGSYLDNLVITARAV